MSTEPNLPSTDVPDAHQDVPHCSTDNRPNFGTVLDSAASGCVPRALCAAENCKSPSSSDIWMCFTCGTLFCRSHIAAHAAAAPGHDRFLALADGVEDPLYCVHCEKPLKCECRCLSVVLKAAKFMALLPLSPDSQKYKEIAEENKQILAEAAKHEDLLALPHKFKGFWKEFVSYSNTLAEVLRALAAEPPTWWTHDHTAVLYARYRLLVRSLFSDALSTADALNYCCAGLAVAFRRLYSDQNKIANAAKLLANILDCATKFPEYEPSGDMTYLSTFPCGSCAHKSLRISRGLVGVIISNLLTGAFLVNNERPRKFAVPRCDFADQNLVPDPQQRLPDLYDMGFILECRKKGADATFADPNGTPGTNATLPGILHYLDRYFKYQKSHNGQSFPGYLWTTRLSFPYTLEEIPPKKLCRVEHLYEGSIEDAKGALQADFANMCLGGGVLTNSAVQEELRLGVLTPELMACLLFCGEAQTHTEAIVMRGAERFSSYKGYSKSAVWAGDYVEENPQRDADGSLKTVVVAIDAIPREPLRQFSPENMLRDLFKAAAGFCVPLGAEGLQEGDDPELALMADKDVATGKWGCGVFKGDLELKFLQQWIATSLAGPEERTLKFYLFEKRPKDPAAKHLLQEDVDLTMKFGLDTIDKLLPLVFDYCAVRCHRKNPLDPHSDYEEMNFTTTFRDYLRWRFEYVPLPITPVDSSC